MYVHYRASQSALFKTICATNLDNDSASESITPRDWFMAENTMFRSTNSLYDWHQVSWMNITGKIFSKTPPKTDNLPEVLKNTIFILSVIVSSWLFLLIYLDTGIQNVTDFLIHSLFPLPVWVRVRGIPIFRLSCSGSGKWYLKNGLLPDFREGVL
jgi:hypothetical protein